MNNIDSDYTYRCFGDQNKNVQRFQTIYFSKKSFSEKLRVSIKNKYSSVGGGAGLSQYHNNQMVKIMFK